MHNQNGIVYTYVHIIHIQVYNIYTRQLYLQDLNVLFILCSNHTVDIALDSVCSCKINVVRTVVLDLPVYLHVYKVTFVISLLMVSLGQSEQGLLFLFLYLHNYRLYIPDAAC